VSQYDADGFCPGIVPGVVPKDCESFNAAEIGAGADRVFRLGQSSRPLQVSLSASVRLADYDAGDPFVDPNVAREDERADIGVNASLPVGDTTSLYARVDYANNTSNLPNFDYNNTSVQVGLTFNF